MHRELDALVVVAASEATQLARVMARDGLARESALARVHAQQPLNEKIRVADYVIDNDGSFDDTRRQVAKVLAAVAKP
jgi:dephospho-CoA kinase